VQGVVALLDSRHYEEVEGIWAELESRFIRQGFCRLPYPHLSFHVGESYDEEKLEPALQSLAAQTSSFSIRTSGLGVFTGGEHPVIYLTVVRSPKLSLFQEQVWQGVDGGSRAAVGYYRPELWVPHITLAEGELAKEHLGEIVRHLAARDLVWEMEVRNLSLIYDDGAKQGVKTSCGLSGAQLTKG
jgi:2'-5' RNA ligase